MRVADLEAYTEVVLKWRVPIRKYLARITNDDHMAEDLAQEVCLKLWLNWDRFDQMERSPGWLIVTAKRLAIDHMNARNRLGRFTAWSALEKADLVEDQTDWFGQILDRSDLETLLGALSAVEAAVTVPWLQGVTYAELAQQLGIPLGTVGSRLTAARARMKQVRTQIA